MNKPATDVALSAPTRDVDPLTWQMVKEQAKLLYMSSLINKEQVRTAHDALLIVLKGRELGVPPTQALQNIVVVKGKATANAELMLALIYRDQGDDAVWFDETTADRCTISYKRRSWPQRKTYAFSFEDAKKAGLTGNQQYQKYPANMLRARCISNVARLAFPDTIGGMYSYEELGVPTTVNDDGQVVLQGEVVDERMDAAPAALPDPIDDVAVLDDRAPLPPFSTQDAPPPARTAATPAGGATTPPQGWAEGVGKAADEEVRARKLYDAVAAAMRDDAPMAEALAAKGRTLDNLTVEELQQTLAALRSRAAKRAQQAADAPTATPTPSEAPDYGPDYDVLYAVISEASDAGELFRRRREVADARDSKRVSNDGYTALMKALNSREAKMGKAVAR